MDKHQPISHNYVKYFTWACKSLPQYADEMYQFKSVTSVQRWIDRNIEGRVKSVGYRLDGEHRWCLYTTHRDGLVIDDHMLVHNGVVDEYTQLVAQAILDIADEEDKMIVVIGKKRNRNLFPYFIAKLQSSIFIKTGFVEIANEILQVKP